MNPEELGLPVDGWVLEITRFFENLANNPGQFIGIIALVLFVFCVLWLVFLALGTIGRIGLVSGASQADKGAESLSFGELWRGSLPYFWRVVGLWLILWLASFVFAIVVGGVVVAGAVLTFGLGLICLLPLLCVLIPLAWLVSVVFEQATIAMVTENLSIPDSLTRAWELVRANIGNYILMALVLFIIELVVGFIMVIPLILLVVPFLIGGALGAAENIGTTLIIMLACFVVYMPVLIVLGGIMRAYVWTAWTLTFVRLSALPRIEPAQPEMLDAS